MRVAIKKHPKRGPVGIFHEILEIGVAILSVMMKELRYADRSTWAKAWGEDIHEFIDFSREKGGSTGVLQQQKMKERRR